MILGPQSFAGTSWVMAPSESCLLTLHLSCPSSSPACPSNSRELRLSGLLGCLWQSWPTGSSQRMASSLWTSHDFLNRKCFVTNLPMGIVLTQLEIPNLANKEVPVKWCFLITAFISLFPPLKRVGSSVYFVHFRIFIIGSPLSIEHLW